MNTTKLCKKHIRDFVFNTTVLLDLVRFLEVCLETAFPLLNVFPSINFREGNVPLFSWAVRDDLDHW